MCPACVAGAATLALSATSTGGFAALLLYRIRRLKKFWRWVSVRVRKEN